MSRLKSITAAIIASSSSSPSYITPGPDAPWTRLGNDKDPQTLRTELEKLYWEGARAELENIIRTLQAWQQQVFASVSVPDETDDFIHGFDTFIDHVSQGAREFAIRYGQTKLGNSTSYETALRASVEDRKVENVGKKLKSSVRRSANGLPKLEGMEQQAWSLLQAAGLYTPSANGQEGYTEMSAGFLDIETLIEPRPPFDKSSKRPAIPQRMLSAIP
ncbi:hypothetical protein VTI74DRAFT_6814 [Chaetomium olivicolor]